MRSKLCIKISDGWFEIHRRDGAALEGGYPQGSLADLQVLLDALREHTAFETSRCSVEFDEANNAVRLRNPKWTCASDEFALEDADALADIIEAWFAGYGAAQERVSGR